MSRFFNETRQAIHGRVALPGPADDVDLQHALETLREDSSDGDFADAGNRIKNKPESFPRDGATEVILVTKPELDKCRTVQLARGGEKTLLAKQYEGIMRTAVEAYKTLRTRLLRRQAKQNTRPLVISSTAQ